MVGCILVGTELLTNTVRQAGRFNLEGSKYLNYKTLPSLFYTILPWWQISCQYIFIKHFISSQLFRIYTLPSIMHAIWVMRCQGKHSNICGQWDSELIADASVCPCMCTYVATSGTHAHTHTHTHTQPPTHSPVHRSTSVCHVSFWFGGYGYDFRGSLGV
jgi:hypothetical protein